MLQAPLAIELTTPTEGLRPGGAVNSVFLFPLPGLAETPSPNHHFYSVAPGSRTLSHQGVVVQALGMDGCNFRRGPAEQDTAYYVQQHELVWFEITPQDYCATAATYESEVAAILSYVAAHTTNADEGVYFAGIMLDEEDGYGFTPHELRLLNTNIEGQVGSTPGHTWWSLEGFVANGSNPGGCDWTYAQYGGVLQIGYQAEQIEHQCNINLVNSQSNVLTLATWSPGYTPGDTRPHACDPLNTSPWLDYVNGYYWSNEFAAT